MTLIALASTKYHSILASDRRLTANGILADGASNKAISVSAPAYRVSFAFTGLAESGRFRTREFLRDEIVRLAPLSQSLHQLLLGIREGLSNVYKKAPIKNIRDAHRPLALGFVGCTIKGGTSQAVYGSVLNFDHFGSGNPVREFYIQLFEVAQGVAFLGALPAVTQQDRNDILDFIDRDAPHRVIAHRMCHRIRLAARRAAAGGAVGEQISWISINRQSLDVEFGQYPESTLDSYSPTLIMVDILGGVNSVENVSVIGPEAKYKLPEFDRGLACPCGSGVQFRRCHGRKFERVGGVAVPIPINDDALLAFPAGYETWGN